MLFKESYAQEKTELRGLAIAVAVGAGCLFSKSSSIDDVFGEEADEVDDEKVFNVG